MFIFSAKLAAFAALATTLLDGVHAAPLQNARTNTKIRRATGPVVAGQWLVKLKKTADFTSHISSLPFAFSIEDTSSPIVEELFGGFTGYVGEFTDADLQALEASPDVEYIEQEQIYTVNEQQTGATWGLQSISSQTSSPVGSFADTLNLAYTYTYSEPIGEGVDIYIVDTGIYIEHEEFEGRATFGYAAGVMQKMDGHGHGTHCAGTAAGKTYGVAKKADLIGVKVLGDNGSGTTSNIIDGLNWILTNIQSTGKPSIVSMSLGGEISQALDDVVNSLISSGVTVVVAAGNSNIDSSDQSPARVPAAITVAAANITNTKASFSNFGAPIDIWAPGVNIISAWPYTGTSATKSLSGTSMATPHIAGMAAYFLSQDTSLTPDAIQDKIVGLGRSNVLGGVPDGTVNLLAYNGEGGDMQPVPPPSESADPTDPLDVNGATNNCPSWWQDCFWAHWW